MATSQEKVNEALLLFLQQNIAKKEPKRPYTHQKLEPYNEVSESFSTYILRLDNYLELNELKGEDDDSVRVQVLISCLSPKHFQLLTDLCAPHLPNTKSYEELIKLLREYLCPTPNEVAEQHKFYTRVQQPEESICTYMKELRRMTLYCNFSCSNCKSNTIEVHLRTQFIRGLRSPEIRERLLQEKMLTLQTAYDLALAMEASRQGSSDIFSPASVNKVTTTPKTKVNNNDMVSIESLKGKCFRCGKSNHKANECKLRNATCFTCNTKGHIAAVCLKASQMNNRNVFQKQMATQEFNGSNENETNIDKSDDEKVAEEYYLHSVSSIYNGKYLLEPLLDGVPCTMEYDTGAAVSSMSLRRFKQLFPNKSIAENTNVKLKTYTGESIKLCGTSEVQIQLAQKSMKGRLFVVHNNVDSIFGREWIRELNVSIHDINQIEDATNRDSLMKNPAEHEILTKYESLFTNEVGNVPEMRVKLPLQADAKPIFVKHRVPPIALKTKIEEELRLLEENGIISKIINTEWGTPIVPILKGDGTVRICADYKTTVNAQLQNDHYPIPRIDEIFDNLNGGKYFTTLDLHKAYLHLQMDEESAMIQAISTHVGVFKVNRLMFGIKTAPNIWQRFMDSVISGLEGTAVFFDDIIVQGRTIEETKLRTIKVLERLKENNLHVNKNKSKFFEESVTYLGHTIDGNGLHKSHDKIEAILKCPTPTNVTELKQFLGLVNYYHRFLPDLATKLHPLYQLLHKTKCFKWTRQCVKAFEDIKKEITTERVLTTFSPDLPLILATDASPHGLSAVLSHKMPDGMERPIAFASRTLSKAESNYSHIIKEATAIYWGVHKFFHYCYGRHFTLITDNKPLSSIFHPSKSLPPLTATRMLHYAVYLSGFDYSIQYRKASDHVNADYLSRFPVENFHDQPDDPISDKYLLQVQINSLPVTSNEVRNETLKDPELKLVYDALQTSSYISKPDQYKGLEGELTLENGCIFRGVRVVIPLTLREALLQELHVAHTGITKMKELARQYCWWPSINSDIEKYVNSCRPCALNKNDPPKYHQPWENAKLPWERVHIDHAGPYKGTYFFIAVDSYTKWLEVQETRSITSTSTIKILREIFARFGIPDTVVSDNGPAFISNEFKSFTKNNGIHHKLMAPYHPASNGQGERYIQTLKRKISAMAEEPGDLHTNLCRFLMQNRKVINITTGRSPSEMMFKRSIRTRLDLLKKVTTPDTESVGNLRHFSPGERVQVRDYRSGHHKWKFGIITARLGICHYEVDVDGIAIKCHVDQLRATLVPPNEYVSPYVPNKLPEIYGRDVKDCKSHIQETELNDSEQTDNEQDIIVPPNVTESPQNRRNSHNLPDMSITPQATRTFYPSYTPSLRRSQRTIKKPLKLDL